MKALLAIVTAALLFGAGCGDSGKPDDVPAPKNDSSTVQVEKPLDTLVFVGMEGRRPALFAYDFKDSSVTNVWKERRESVLKFLYSPDEKNAFFITARKEGTRGALPFIDKVKIYLFDTGKLTAKEILELGNGLQTASRWMTDSTFEVVFHYYDLFDANFIEQRILLFNNAGKVLSDKKRTFELSVDGFPQFPEQKIITSSSNGRFALNVDYEENRIFRLTDREDEEEFILFKSNQRLRQLEWLPGDSLLIFSTINLSSENKTLTENNPETSTLILYNVNSRKKITEFTGGGYKNFLYNGGRVIFDSGFEEASSLSVFTVKEPDSLLKIERPKGCGLQFIPELPEFNQP